MVTERKMSRYGEFSTSYTSQNLWTILGSSKQIRIRHLKHTNPDILVFACSHKKMLSLLAASMEPALTKFTFIVTQNLVSTLKPICVVLPYL